MDARRLMKGRRIKVRKKGKGEKPMSDNPYYTVKPKKVSVSESAFKAFLTNYPRKLDYDCNATCDPPAISYNDFELADRWPYSVVASTHAYDDDPDGYYYEKPEDRQYVVMENYEEVFASKTGYKAEEAPSSKADDPFFAFGFEPSEIKQTVVFHVCFPDSGDLSVGDGFDMEMTNTGWRYKGIVTEIADGIVYAECEYPVAVLLKQNKREENHGEQANP